MLSDSEIIEVIELLMPKIKKALKQTAVENRDDLEQELKELIIKKLKRGELDDIPGFYEFIKKL